jgi:hypothetical protein
MVLLPPRQAQGSGDTASVVGRLALLALLAVLAGCMGDDAVPPDRLGRLVLQPDDLPEGFERFDEGELAGPDMPPGPRRDPARFGREGGWKARYRAPAGDTGGILLVESRVDAFAGSGGAERDLDAYREQLAASGAEEDAGADVGDEALATTATQAAEPRAIRFTTVAWRQGTVTASVLVQGFEDAAGVDAVLELARKQAARIERESG